MASQLPIGEVTLLFTDIEGSTRLLRDLGDSYADALAARTQTGAIKLDARRSRPGSAPGARLSGRMGGAPGVRGPFASRVPGGLPGAHRALRFWRTPIHTPIGAPDGRSGR